MASHGRLPRPPADGLHTRRRASRRLWRGGRRLFCIREHVSGVGTSRAIFPTRMVPRRAGIGLVTTLTSKFDSSSIWTEGHNKKARYDRDFGVMSVVCCARRDRTRSQFGQCYFAPWGRMVTNNHAKGHKDDAFRRTADVEADFDGWVRHFAELPPAAVGSRHDGFSFFASCSSATAADDEGEPRGEHDAGRRGGEDGDGDGGASSSAPTTSRSPTATRRPGGNDTTIDYPSVEETAARNTTPPPPTSSWWRRTWASTASSASSTATRS